MKKLALSLLVCSIAAGAAYAGQEVSDSSYKYSKDVKEVIEPCFQDRELQLDIFGTYNDNIASSRYADGFGGGIGVNYFFSRHIGIGVDGNIYDAKTTELWQVTGQVIFRFPLELGSLCIAPYIYGGGGVQTDHVTVGLYHAGGGLEFRATPTIGVFTEGRYIWAADDGGDTAQARVGVRFVF